MVEVHRRVFNTERNSHPYRLYVQQPAFYQLQDFSDTVKVYAIVFILGPCINKVVLLKQIKLPQNMSSSYQTVECTKIKTFRSNHTGKTDEYC